ncbi:MAG TPA: hypothetical protein VFQ43_15415 [Nitrososphaera sp.]|nr:hypothetical protein [Nitrososphaera sp.]
MATAATQRRERDEFHHYGFIVWRNQKQHCRKGSLGYRYINWSGENGLQRTRRARWRGEAEKLRPRSAKPKSE